MLKNAQTWLNLHMLDFFWGGRVFLTYGFYHYLFKHFFIYHLLGKMSAPRSGFPDGLFFLGVLLSFSSLFPGLQHSVVRH